MLTRLIANSQLDAKIVANENGAVENTVVSNEPWRYAASRYQKGQTEIAPALVGGEMPGKESRRYCQNRGIDESSNAPDRPVKNPARRMHVNQIRITIASSDRCVYQMRFGGINNPRPF